MNKENVSQAFKTVKVTNRELEALVNSRVSSLQRELQEKEYEITQLQMQKNGPSHSRLHEIKQDALQLENQQLKNQIHQYENMLKNAQNKNNSYQGQLGTMTNLLQETQQILEFERQAKQALQLQQSNIQLDAESEKSAIKTQIDVLRKEKYQFQSQYQEIELQLKQSQLINTELTQELTTLSNSFSQLQISYHQVEQKSYDLESKNEILTSQLEVYKVQHERKQIPPQDTEQQILKHEKVSQLEAKLSLSYDKIAELEAKLRLANETAEEKYYRLQEFLQEKQEYIKKLEKQRARQQSVADDNQQLIGELEKSQLTKEELQYEHQQIVKFQKQQLDQLKRQLEQQSNNNEELVDTKQMLQIVKVEFENYKSMAETKFNEYQQQIEIQSQCMDKSKTHIQSQQTNHTEFLQNQSLDQLRIQVESQMALKYASEKVQLENQLWYVQDQLNGIQNSIEMYINKISQLNVENDQLREQLLENSNNQKQVLIYETQIRNFCIEIEKQKNIIQQKSEQLEYVSQRRFQNEQLANYISELEKKIAYLNQDNQRLNGVLIQRCKNSW